jgi:plasmid stabilization system protein ParE
VDSRLLSTQKALNGLAEIVGHIADDDAEAASRFAESWLDHLDLLVCSPRLGCAIRKRARVRKLWHSPILAYYQVHEERRLIEVLHLRHGPRPPPKGLKF